MRIYKYICILMFCFFINGNQIKSEEINTKDSSKKRNTAVKKIGLAYGTPGDLNIVFGATNKKVCFGLSAGMNGVQIGAGINAISEKKYEVNLLLNASLLRIKNDTEYNHDNFKDNEIYYCFGPILECNFYGFHSQIGVGFGIEQIPKIPIFYQIGYTYRWGK